VKGVVEGMTEGKGGNGCVIMYGNAEGRSKMMFGGKTQRKMDYKVNNG